MAIMSMQMDVTSRAKNSKGGKLRNCSTASKSHYISRTGRYACQPKPASTGNKESDSKTADQFKYNTRKEQFADRHADEIVFKGCGNMPQWAKNNPQQDDQHYWDACDKYERENGRLSRNFILALPRELTDDERYELTQGFCTEIARTKAFDRLPFSFAIHQDKDNHNPHAHIMISERVNDGIPRNASTWFKRSNSKNPKDGGAVKTQELKSKAWLIETRRKWAEYCNTFLDSKDWIDHRSLKAQGIKRLPTIHVGKTKYMDKKSQAFGLSTPLERTQHNEKIKELNAIYRDCMVLKMAAHQPKNSLAKMVVNGLRRAYMPDIQYSQKHHVPRRLQNVKFRVQPPPMNQPTNGSFMKYVERIIEEIMDNQRKIWDNEIALLNEQTDHFREVTKLMKKEAAGRMCAEISAIRSRPRTIEKLLSTDDQWRDRFFKKIRFSERHTTHGELAKVQTIASSTSAKVWVDDVDIVHQFAIPSAIKPTTTPTMKSAWDDEFEDMLNEPSQAPDFSKHLKNAELFVQKPSPAIAIKQTNQHVSLAELEAQMKAREVRRKNHPAFVNMTSPLKPKPPMQ